MLRRYSHTILVGAVLSFGFALQGCQPKSSNDKDKSQVESSKPQQTEVKSHFNGLITAKTQDMTLPSPRACDETGCTDFQVQRIETNQKWINDYFIGRIKRDLPLAFENPSKNPVQENVPEVELSQSSITVRYIGQNDQLATFVISNSIYTAGAAHGMYHEEYVNFDLKQKKRIALQDLLVAGAEEQATKALYDANSMWLDQHNVALEKLKLSDNFYYGAQGIVFVYPLYELASYAEGMTELVLPYSQVKGLIQPQYLPNLPHYPSS